MEKIRYLNAIQSAVIVLVAPWEGAVYAQVSTEQTATPARDGSPATDARAPSGPGDNSRPSGAPAPQPLPAIATLPSSSPPSPASQPSPALVPPTVLAKFSATLYGFVEFDSIYDSTQSFVDLAGNGAVAREGSFAAGRSRTTFSARNSRLGFKLKGPETVSIKSSAIVEMDFLGNQPQGAPAPAASPAVSEASFFTSPTLRMRHLALRMETPVVDVLAGQYWKLFGWQALFHPNTVEYQGVPGQIYSRSPQLRLSHAFKSDAVTLELAIAASRPPQRDSAIPDGEAGIRIALNKWKALHTTGAAGTAVDPMSLGVSGVGRYFRLPEFSATPTATKSTKSFGVSVDALIPILPATTVNDGNALTLTGSYVYGQAIADLFTGLSGGVGFPALPANAMGVVPPYPQDIDNGLVVYSSDGVLHPIRWQSILVGAQYYFPTPIRMWVSANYSHLSSPNIAELGTMATNPRIFNKSDWFDGNYFIDATGAIRFGLEYAQFRQTYLDGVKAKNSRVQVAAFYIF